MLRGLDQRGSELLGFAFAFSVVGFTFEEGNHHGLWVGLGVLTNTCGVGSIW